MDGAVGAAGFIRHGRGVSFTDRFCVFSADLREFNQNLSRLTKGVSMVHRLSNRGFTLIELAIGLAVLTVLILAISMSSGIRDNARAQSAAQSVQALRSAAESYLATGRLNYTGMDIAALKASNMLPANFNGSGTNPWGGDYVIAADASDPTRFNIALSSLSTNDASKLTSYFNNAANTSVYDTSSKTWTVTF